MLAVVKAELPPERPNLSAAHAPRRTNARARAYERGMARSRIIAVALALVLVLAAAAQLSFAKPKPPPKPKHPVTIKGNYAKGYKFKPGKITIKKNETVTWGWSSDAPHNVTFDTINKHSKTDSKVSGFKVKFKNAGTFSYKCTVHGFTGKVVVTAK
jgi:plastocyanin